MASSLAGTFWWSADCALVGTISRQPVLYARQVRTPCPIPCSLHVGGAQSRYILPLGRQGCPNDTASLLDLLLRHREQLRQLQPDSMETACCSS